MWIGLKERKGLVGQLLDLGRQRSIPRPEVRRGVMNQSFVDFPSA